MFLCYTRKSWSTDKMMPALSGINTLKRGGGRRGRDRMVVGFTTTYVIGAYHH